VKVLEDAAARLVDSSPDAPPVETIRARADGLRRRRRARQSGLVAVAICAVVGAGALGISVIRDEGQPANVVANSPSQATDIDTITYRDDARGFQITYPNSWFRAEHSLTPDPWEATAVATFDLGATPPNENCDHQPEGALRGVGPTDAFVWVYLPAWDPAGIPPRPDRIAELPTGADQYSDLLECLGGTVEFTSRGYRFADDGRVLGLTVALGAEASPETRRQTLGVLNSIELDPATTATTVTTLPPITIPSTSVPVTTVPATPVPTAITGSYSGDERWGLSNTSDCDLDHHLELTFEVAGDPVPWQFRSDYCGKLDGKQWTGSGPFTIDAGEKGTLTGTMQSAARLPTEGEPFTLEITGGTGSFEGAAGSCILDNHLRTVALGQQEQWGTFECAVTT
jgi:hypothetical protein